MAARIRVSYFLPLTNTNDQTAYYRTLDYLRSPRPAVEGRPPVSGFTVSSSDPPAFAGFYWSEGQQVWLRDSIAILFVDLPASELIDEIAQSLKAAVVRFYADEGSPQEEMWCTLERIDVI
jgi:hypothetical protein